MSPQELTLCIVNGTAIGTLIGVAIAIVREWLA